MFNVRFTSDDVHSLCGLQGDSSVSHSYRLVSKLLNKKTAGINTDVHTSDRFRGLGINGTVT